MKDPQNIFKYIKCIYNGINIDNIIYDNESFSPFSPISSKDSFPIISNKNNSFNQNEHKKNDNLNDNNIIEKKTDIFNLNYSSTKIFNINKVNKLGRIKKNSNKKGKHNKLQKDNIIRLFKVRLMKNIYDYINSSFLINKNPKKKKINILKKISSRFIMSNYKKIILIG